MTRQQGFERALPWALLALVAGVVHAGLSPYEFRPENRVRRLAPGPGVVFEGRGIATSEAPLRFGDPERPAGLSIELALRPLRTADADGGIALGIFDDGYEAPLAIAQWKQSLYLRHRIDHPPAGGPTHRTLALVPAIEPGAAYLVAASSGPHGTALFVDGVPVRPGPSRIPIVPPGQRLEGRLALGSDEHAGRNWTGEVLGLAVFARELDADEVIAHASAVAEGGFSALAGTPGLAALYPMDEAAGETLSDRAGARDLRIDPLLRPLERRLLALPNWREHREQGFAADVARNLLGFVPLGLLLALVLRRRAGASPARVLVASLLTAGLLSLTVESLQALLPTRVSSAQDLALNTLGAGLGALLVLAPAARARRQSARP